MDFRGSVKTTKFMHTIMEVDVKSVCGRYKFIKFSKGFGLRNG